MNDDSKSDQKKTATDHRLHLRTVEPSDESFLFRVFASTRPDIVHANLLPVEKENFLRMQFQAQDVHYRRTYAEADYSVICNDGQDIGRLYVQRAEHEIRILDIALLPEFRSAGLGTILVKGLLHESKTTRRPVVIHVELQSREIAFYERLGFVKVHEIPTHQLMKWDPAEKETDANDSELPPVTERQR